MRRHDLRIADRLDAAARLVAGGDRALPGGWISDSNRGRDRSRSGDRLAAHQWRRTLRLGANHLWSGGALGAGQLREAAPGRRDVAAISHRNEQLRRDLAELLDDLEGGRLLPLDPIRGHGVN